MSDVAEVKKPQHLQPGEAVVGLLVETPDGIGKIDKIINSDNVRVALDRVERMSEKGKTVEKPIFGIYDASFLKKIEEKGE